MCQLPPPLLRELPGEVPVPTASPRASTTGAAQAGSVGGDVRPLQRAEGAATLEHVRVHEPRVHVFKEPFSREEIDRVRRKVGFVNYSG